jgi:hypothetical protein
MLWAGDISGTNISPQGHCLALLVQVLHGKLATATCLSADGLQLQQQQH